MSSRTPGREWQATARASVPSPPMTTFSAPPRPDAPRGAATAAPAAALLSHWWSRPTAVEVETWRADSAFAGEAFDGLPLPTPPSRAEVPSLLDEHERLFVGPGPVPCPPFESCWRSDVPIDRQRSLMGPCTSDLREVYLRLGLELAFVGAEFTDYLPVELEAFGVALSHTDGADLSRSLFVDHLHRWLPKFADSVRRETRHPFYRDLAQVTALWTRSIASAWAESSDDG